MAGAGLKGVNRKDFIVVLKKRVIFDCTEVFDIFKHGVELCHGVIVVNVYFECVDYIFFECRFLTVKENVKVFCILEGVFVAVI